jgi:hypothetical protein
MVTGCPPVALLALIELLNHVLTHHHTETTGEKINETSPGRNETDSGHNESDALPATRLSRVSSDPRPQPEPTAEQKMWAYFVTERSKGRTPSGAELDRVFSTNNYGRSVLRKWRDEGRIPSTVPADLTRDQCLPHTATRVVQSVLTGHSTAPVGTIPSG